MDAEPEDSFRKILLLLLLPIGDTLFATPAIRALRRAYPEAHITAAVFPTNRGILENNSDVDRLVVHATREAWPGAVQFLHYFAARRRERYDLVVQFGPFHDHYGLTVGIPQQLRLPCPWLYWLLPHRNKRWRTMHAIDHYREVLRPLGLHTADRKLVLKLSGQQEAFAERYLAEAGYREGELLVGVHAGGSGFKGMKRWSPGGFAWVARQLGRDYRVRLVFFGSDDERDLAEAVVAAGVPNGYVNACGKTTLSETAALLGTLDLFIGNDSGPLHMAAALGTPSVGIFGPTDVLTYRPQGPRVGVVSGSVHCPANYGFIGTRTIWQQRECAGECLESVQPAEVHSAAMRLLSGVGDGGLEPSTSAMSTLRSNQLS